MTEEIKALENRIKDMQFQIDDLRNMRNPMRANERIDLLQTQISEFGVKIDEMNNRLNAYIREDKFIETFTDEEFNLLLISSIFTPKSLICVCNKSILSFALIGFLIFLKSSI